MKNSVKRFFKEAIAGVMTVMVSCTCFSGCNASTTTISAPTLESPSTVVSVADNLEVGLSPGFALPHDAGLGDNTEDEVMIFEDELYYHNNESTEGADPGILYTSEEDIRDTYQKLLNRDKQYATFDLSTFETKYGTLDQWLAEFKDAFYMVKSSADQNIDAITKQKYPEAVFGGYMLQKSYDLVNWKQRGEVGGEALLGEADGWYHTSVTGVPDVNCWAPEIYRDPLTGMYILVGSSNTKDGKEEDDYNAFPTIIRTEGNMEQYENLNPLIAISVSPAGPYRYITNDLYYSFLASFNEDGSVRTVEKDGKTYAVYRKDIKKGSINKYEGYEILTEYSDGVFLNGNGLNVTKNTCLLSVGYYHEELRKANADWSNNGKGIFPAMDTNLVIDNNGDYYLYFTEHACSVVSNQQIWVLPMLDLCTPDWSRFTHVTSPSFSVVYYDGVRGSAFYKEDVHSALYTREYANEKGGFNSLKFAINGIPGYYMGNSSEGGVNEGTHVIEKDGYYYMTYSPFGLGSRMYSLYMAVADNPFGPFIKVPEYSPNLGLDQSESQDYMAGTGHHSFVNVGDEMWCMYHYFFNPVNNEPDGSFIGRIIGTDRIGWYDYDQLSFSGLVEKQIENDLENATELRSTFNSDEEMEAWLKECYETGNHRNYEKCTKSDIVPLLYGNGPTYSLQPKPEVFTGYKNVAKTATVTILEGDTATAKYANDGMFTYQKWSNPYEVVGNPETRQLKLKLSWDTPQTIRNIMVYNSRDYVYAFNNVKSVAFALASKPTWYPENKEYNGYCHIKNLKPDSQGWDDSNMVMRKGGSAMATFNEITVSEIIITIDAKDKVGGLILTSSNRYVVKLSDIYIMGNPAVTE